MWFSIIYNIVLKIENETIQSLKIIFLKSCFIIGISHRYGCNFIDMTYLYHYGWLRSDSSIIHSPPLFKTITISTFSLSPLLLQSFISLKIFLTCLQHLAYTCGLPYPAQGQGLLYLALQRIHSTVFTLMDHQ